MKTILVPVDFSPTSENAAIYALSLAYVISAEKIILYHAYQVTALATPMMTDTATIPITTLPLMNMETMEEFSRQSMNTLKVSIKRYCPEGVSIEEKTDYGTMDDINEICESTSADLIVMGVTGLGKLEEVLMGSTAISVVKTTRTPVIIVPKEARYHQLQNVMLASDFKNVAETTPVQPIKILLDATHAKLHVLNIYESDKEITADKTYQQEILNSLLREYEPQFYFKSNDSFVDAINDFVDKNNIDMIITIPKKHSFFDGLFKERHIKKLAFHSHVPLMYIH